MGRTESSAARIGQNVPAAGSRFELQDFKLEDLAQAFGARPATFLSSTLPHSHDERDAPANAASLNMS